MQARTRTDPTDELERLAAGVREHIIRMSSRGGCFLGASMSCADLLTYLYARVLRIDPRSVQDPQRDYLLLSKGHAAAALYGVLAEFGFLQSSRLDNHLRLDDSIYWHPSRSIPGVEFHSGSLGHGLGVGVGIAIDIKLRGGTNNVFVILGDGELNEGSVWEASLVASARKLDNLVAVVDRNGFQANVRTEDLVPLDPIADKFESFGWRSSTVDGHSFAAMDAVFAGSPVAAGRPTAVIANTVRGKGLPSMEGREDRWFVASTEREAALMIAELRGSERCRQHSPVPREAIQQVSLRNRE